MSKLLNDAIKARGIHFQYWSDEWKKALKLDTDTPDGLAFRLHDDYYILANPDTGVDEGRYIISHELGHIMLGHLRGKIPEYAEMEANIFASVLMAFQLILEVYPGTAGGSTPQDAQS